MSRRTYAIHCDQPQNIASPLKELCVSSALDLPSFARDLLDAIEASGFSRRQIARQAGAGCSEATLTNWTAGRGKPDPQSVFKLEEILGLAPGRLSRHLGYCPCDQAPPEPGVEESILADPSLTSEARAALLRVYRLLAGRGAG